MMSSLSGLYCKLVGILLLLMVIIPELAAITPTALVDLKPLRSVSMGCVGAIGYSTYYIFLLSSVLCSRFLSLVITATCSSKFYNYTLVFSAVYGFEAN